MRHIRHLKILDQTATGHRCPEERRITLEHLSGHGINVPQDELAYLALITRAINQKQIFEIWTFRGRTALNFALNYPDDCIIWTLDLPLEGRDEFARTTGTADSGIIMESIPGIDYRGKDVESKIWQLYGNSMEFDFTPYHGAMDLVFVDGAHHHDAAKSDTMNALEIVKQHGLIIWHDFCKYYGDYNDVTRAALDVFPGEESIQICNTQLAVFRQPRS